MIPNSSIHPVSPELAMVDPAVPDPGATERDPVLPSPPAWAGAPAEFHIPESGAHAQRAFTATPASGVHAEPSTAVFDVHVHLINGERIHVASFADEAGAKKGCRDLAERLSTLNGWPFFAGRFVRPDAIVSLDLEPAAERPPS